MDREVTRSVHIKKSESIKKYQKAVKMNWSSCSESRHPTVGEVWLKRLAKRLVERPAERANRKQSARILRNWQVLGREQMSTGRR